MWTILKGAEPPSLREYRAVPGAVYDGAKFTPVKNDVRDALLRDQSHLCCYCLRRIARSVTSAGDEPAVRVSPTVEMKVEHWRPQSQYPALALDWRNLLGACPGNMGAAPSEQTCDTRKGDAEILLNPLDPSHMATLRCTSSGRLESTYPRMQSDLDERLGLNIKILQDGRRRVLERSLRQLRARYAATTIPEREVRDAITAAESTRDGRASEMCAVLRLWARKRYGGAW